MDKCVIDMAVLSKYIPREEPDMLPVKSSSYHDSPEAASEREAIIRTLFQLKQDVDYLKGIIAKAGLGDAVPSVSTPAIAAPSVQEPADDWVPRADVQDGFDEDPEEQDYLEGPEKMSIKAVNRELIEKVLKKHGGNRKAAAAELGISERTLYRKLKEMN